MRTTVAVRPGQRRLGRTASSRRPDQRTMCSPSSRGSAARPADTGSGARPVLLGRLLAHERAPDQRRAGDPQRLGRHAPRRRVDEREPRHGLAPVERERGERAPEQVRGPDAVARVAERRPRRQALQADDRGPVGGGDVDRAAPGVRDPPALELREPAQQVAPHLLDDLVVDLHPAAGPRARRHPAAGPAEHDPPVARRARVVQQRAAVGDRLAAGPAERLDHVGHRLRADDVARGHGEPVAQRRRAFRWRRRWRSPPAARDAAAGRPHLDPAGTGRTPVHAAALEDPRAARQQPLAQAEGQPRGMDGRRARA